MTYAWYLKDTVNMQLKSWLLFKSWMAGKVVLTRMFALIFMQISQTASGCENRTSLYITKYHSTVEFSILVGQSSFYNNKLQKKMVDVRLMLHINV